MREIDPNLEDFFRARFEHFESEPAPESWSAIQNRLHQKRRRPVAFWWWSAAGIAAAFVAFLWWQPTNNMEKTVIDIAKNEKIEQKNEEKNDAQNLKEYDTVRQAIEKRIDNNEQKSIVVQQKHDNEKNTVKEVLKNKPTIINAEKNVEKEIFEKNFTTQNISNEAINNPEQISLNSDKNTVLNDEYITFLPTLTSNVVSLEQKSIRFAPFTFETSEKITKVADSKNKKQVNFNFNIAPTYHFKNIKLNTEDDVFMKNISIPTATSTQRFGLQGEAKINLIRNKWGIYGGLNYQYMPFSMSYEERANESATVNISSNGSSLTVNNVDYAYNQVSLKQPQHNLNLVTGISFAPTSKTTLQAGIGAGKWLGKSSFERNAFFATMSISQKIGKISLTPFARYDLKYYQHESNLFSVQPYQLGLKFGF
jgi:hypothetical protein